MMSLLTKRGQILVLTVIVIGAVAALAVILNGLVQQNNTFANLRYHQENALELAQAGIDYARWDMNVNLNFTGSTVTLTTGAFITTITQVSANLAEIESTGYSPSQTNPKGRRIIRVNATIDTTNVAFNYGVQVGDGGVTMDNNSVIAGNLFSNGLVLGSGTITGTAEVATGAVLGASHEIQSASPDGDYIFGRVSPELDAAQSFSIGSTNTVTKVSLRLKKACQNNMSNKCPPNLTARILGDSAGSPNENNVVASGTLDQGLVSLNSYGWTDITIDTPATLTGGQTYWIVVSASDVYPAGNNDRYWLWGKDKNQGYGNGLAKYSPDWNTGSPSWTTIVGDLNFRVFVGANTTFLEGVTVDEDVYAYEIRDAEIGDEAFYQVIDASSQVSGSPCPNAACHPDTPAPGLQNLPLSDANIADFKNEAIAGGAITGDFTVDGTSTSLGPKEITGNLVVTNSAQLRVTGTLYVHGTILVDNNAVIYLDPAYGGLSGTVISDDAITSQNNARFCGSGWDVGAGTCDTSQGSYIMLLTVSPKQVVSDPAIAVKNNTQSVIFYAQSGTIALSNNAGLYEAVGYKLHLSENAVVTYEAGLADADFTSGPGASWQVQPGTWREVF